MRGETGFMVVVTALFCRVNHCLQPHHPRYSSTTCPRACSLHLIIGSMRLVCTPAGKLQSSTLISTSVVERRSRLDVLVLPWYPLDSDPCLNVLVLTLKPLTANTHQYAGRIIGARQSSCTTPEPKRKLKASNLRPTIRGGPITPRFPGRRMTIGAGRS